MVKLTPNQQRRNKTTKELSHAVLDVITRAEGVRAAEIRGDVKVASNSMNHLVFNVYALHKEKMSSVGKLGLAAIGLADIIAGELGIEPVGAEIGSSDEQAIRAQLKYKVECRDGSAIFWIAVHGAETAQVPSIKAKDSFSQK